MGVREVESLGVLCVLWTFSLLTFAAAAMEEKGGAEVASGGYVSNEACTKCHASIAADYSLVSKSRSFYRPSSQESIEDFSTPFYHEASDRHYRYVRRGNDLVFQRYQVDGGGERINEIELAVDWIIGSGNQSRTYLYQTSNGELFELPVSWYSQGAGWRMSPGYDRKHHDGVGKRISQECLSCHNAYPDSPKGRGLYSPVHDYPLTLREGIGCQRCHGPGAGHVAKAETPGSPLKTILDSIVNPAKLPAERRHQICLSCHMAPSAAVPAIRRFDEPEFSFRPGQAYEEHRLWLDIEEADHGSEERFEINHHAYRLLQSRCFISSRGSLSCLRCHDPHRKVAAAERIDHYAAVCLTCHTEVAEKAGHGVTVKAWKTAYPQYRSVQDADCARCHMPKRRTQDVVHVAVTDHKIRRIPLAADPLVPLLETQPTINDIRLLFSNHETDADTWKLYRAVATLRAAGGAQESALDFLEDFFLRQARPELEPYLDMLNGQLKLGRIEKARITLTEVLRRDPQQPQALKNLALIESSQGNQEEALSIFERLVQLEPLWSDAYIGLGRELRLQDRHAEAIQAIRKALDLRSNEAIAWYELGLIYATEKEWSKAAAALKKCLAFDPGFAPAYHQIAEVYEVLHRQDEALRYLRHGVQNARRPDTLRTKLDEMEK